VPKLRSILVAALALAGAVTIVRSAYVSAFASTDPTRAARLWDDHPDVLISRALTDIGTAAVRRQNPPAGAIEQLQLAARLAPFAHDPFLAHGIQEEVGGHGALAEQAFLAARLRAPREAAPRYFLAQHYLNSNRGDAGLAELSTLARLLPTGPASVAPSLAAYARSTSDHRALKAAFRNNPSLEQAVLTELSKDAANAALMLSLATKLHRPDGTVHDWVASLLPRLVDAGRSAEAYRIWQAASRANRSGPLFDPEFRGDKAPPPFNWSLLSDSRGFAEPDGQGGLHVIFYGRDNADLAGQTLLLPPGRYRLAMRVAGNPSGLLKWSLTCLPGTDRLDVADLGSVANAVRSGEFAVPANCLAQRLNLSGVSLDLPKQVDITISQLDLRRADAG
jgi:hypothetical protein